MATKPYDPAEANPAARAAYLDGASVGYLRRRFGLSPGEIEDVAPEEFAGIPKPESSIGGY